MKQLLSAFCILVLASAFTFGIKSFTPGHKYTVVLTEEQWNAGFGHLNNALGIMRKSTFPGAQISDAQDSLVEFAREMQLQIFKQQQADTLKKK